MAEGILVIGEQQQGRLNRLSWEALAAAQQFGERLGQAVVAALVGKAIAAAAEELAGKKVAAVWCVEHDLLARYTLDSYTRALQQLISQLQPRFVFMPHTYQVRDFAPKLAAALRRGLVSDCIGYRLVGDQPIFVRMMFQGKINADVTFTGEAPHFVTFQAGAFRADAVVAADKPAPIQKAEVTLSAELIRTQPEEAFREAKQAVDLSQAEIIVAVGRGIKAQENVTLAGKLAAYGASGGQFRPDRSAQALLRPGHLWRHSARGRDEGLENDCRGKQGRQCAHL